MTQTPSQSLLDRLQAVAGRWIDAHPEPRPTLARLGRLVVNDGGFMARIADSQQGPTTATLEKFARYFADPASWPDGDVPDEAQAFAHVVGVSPAEVGQSPGKTGGNSTVTEQRDAA